MEQFAGGSKISGNAEHLKWELKQNLEKEFKIKKIVNRDLTFTKAILTERKSAVDALTVSHLTTETEQNQDFQQCHIL